MMPCKTSFVTIGDLIFVAARIEGRRTSRIVSLVIDTGAALTTITPSVAYDLGYTADHALRKTRVTTAMGVEHGYTIEVERLSVLGLGIAQFEMNVFDLGHRDLDGLLGMNFLALLNFEVRSAEHRIVAEPATRPSPAWL